MLLKSSGYNLLIILIASFCFGSLSFHTPEQKQHSISGKAQGTTYLVTYYHGFKEIKHDQIDSILLLVDKSMSLYKDNSLISKINRSKKGGMVDPLFLKVMQKAIAINKDTEGIFDITVAPLVAAWGFSYEKPKTLPDSTGIAAIMPFVGMKFIQLERGYLRKLKPEVKIDLNGIAQGYTVDLISDFLLKQGIENFLVEIGGELRVNGLKPTGDNFLIGIEGPVNSHNNDAMIKHTVVLKNQALTTSGSYRNYLLRNNLRLSHIIDPKTGYPVKSDILSVTVAAKDAITADGYDNALLAMGIADAIKFVNARREIEAYFVYLNGENKVADTMSSGFRKLLKN